MKKKNVLRHYGGCQCVAIQWLKCSECVLECSYADVWVIARAILKSLLYSPKKRHKSCYWGGTLSKDQGFTKPVIIRMGIFVAIGKNMSESKVLICLLCQN